MYRSQILEQPTSIRGGTAANGGSQGCYVYNRWGKVGEIGKYSLDGPYDSEDAIKKFKSIFKTKFGNKWDDVCNDRDSFVKQAKKYVRYQFYIFVTRECKILTNFFFIFFYVLLSFLGT